MHTILIAEDDGATRSLLEAGLKRIPDCTIASACHGAEALAILKTHSVDLLITDLRMPILDGYALIAIATQCYPQMPILVITSLEEAEHQNLPITLGAAEIFPKPLRLSQMREAIQALLGPRPPRGAVRGLSLGGILQLMEWERRDATLDIHLREQHAKLFLRQGQVVHASWQTLSGLPAAIEVLGWENPSIAFVAECQQERTIHAPLTELLLTAAIRRDEGAVKP